MPSIEETLKERGDRYGSFEDHAKIAQALQDVIRGEDGWDYLAADQKQALTVICDKIARILNGDPKYRDNWHDIVGYAKLVDDRMAREEERMKLHNAGCDRVVIPWQHVSQHKMWAAWDTELGSWAFSSEREALSGPRYVDHAARQPNPPSEEIRNFWNAGPAPMPPAYPIPWGQSRLTDNFAGWDKHKGEWIFSPVNSLLVGLEGITQREEAATVVGREWTAISDEQPQGEVVIMRADGSTYVTEDGEYVPDEDRYWKPIDMAAQCDSPWRNINELRAEHEGRAVDFRLRSGEVETDVCFVGVLPSDAVEWRFCP